MIFITQKDTREKLTQQFIDRTLDYYESDDFKSNYAPFLLEDTHDAIDRIISVAKNSFDADLNKLQAEQILEHLRSIEPNDEFVNWYVGSDCIDSVSFGEQEEEIPTDFLPVIKMLKYEFSVNRQYLYTDLSSKGLQYTLTEQIIIDTFLND